MTSPSAADRSTPVAPIGDTGQARWPVIMLEIEADGSPAVLRQIVERAADRLMESLLAAPDITDPSIGMSVHHNDWDEPTIVPSRGDAS